MFADHNFGVMNGMKLKTKACGWLQWKEVCKKLKLGHMGFLCLLR